MFDYNFIVLPVIVFLSYMLKGAAGFGGAVLFVSAGSAFVGPGNAVVLSAIFETIGGAILFFKDSALERKYFWIPLAVSMTIGSVSGGIALKMVSIENLKIILGCFILITGIWFIFGRMKNENMNLSDSIPVKSSFNDNIFSAVSGFTSGFLGMGGPIIVYWLGRKFAKYSFRRILIPVFFFASIARLMTYIFMGLFTQRTAMFSVLSVIPILAGVSAGTKLFGLMSEKAFSIFIGIILILLSIHSFFS